jgi:hypothetical protein
VDIVERRTPQNEGDEFEIFRAKGDGDEFLVPGLVIVNRLDDGIAFKSHTLPFSGKFLAVESALIGLGANNENELGFLDLVEAPLGPALGRSLFIAVNAGVDPVGSELLRELQYKFHVFVGIVAVADEDFRGLCVRHGDVGHSAGIIYALCNRVKSDFHREQKLGNWFASAAVYCGVVPK